MKVVTVLCFIGIVCAAPSQLPSEGCNTTEDKKEEPKTKDTKILRYDNNNKGLGEYNFAFEQSDGTKHQQQGELIKKDSGEYLAVKGSFTFIGPDGVTYTITYTADDKGFKPEIDQGPGGGVPEAVVASMLG